MDTIQSVLDVHLKRTIQEPSFIFEHPEIPEVSYPPLIPYITWLRKINAVHNQPDEMHVNEQRLREFKLLFQHNLLLFLKVKDQFKTIHKPFKAPFLAIKFRGMIPFGKKVRRKKKQLKIRTLSAKLTPGNEIHKQELWIHSIQSLFKRDFHPQYPSKKIATPSIEDTKTVQKSDNNMLKKKHKCKQQQDEFHSYLEINRDATEEYINCFLSLFTLFAENNLTNTIDSEQEIILKDRSIFNRYSFFSPSAQRKHETAMGIRPSLNFFEEETIGSRLI
jgi:hypothetical protein